MVTFHRREGEREDISTTTHHKGERITVVNYPLSMVHQEYHCRNGGVKISENNQIFLTKISQNPEIPEDIP